MIRITKIKLKIYVSMLLATIFAAGLCLGSPKAVAQVEQKGDPNVLSVFPGEQTKNVIRFGFGSIKTLKMADASAILTACPSIVRVSPSVTRKLDVNYRNRSSKFMIQGTGDSYPIISNHVIGAGRYFTASEVKGLKNVCVLGSKSYKGIFKNEPPIGKKLLIMGVAFEVVGVLKEKGEAGYLKPDELVYIPVSTALRLFHQDYVQAINCQVRTKGLSQKAQDEIELLLRKRHHRTDLRSDFIVFNWADLKAAQAEQKQSKP